MAGANTRLPSVPAVAARPTAPTVLRIVRRDSALICVPLVIAYSFRFKTTTWTCLTLGRACPTDHARISQRRNGARLGFNADWPEIDDVQDHDLAVGAEN